MDEEVAGCKYKKEESGLLGTVVWNWANTCNWVFE